MGQTASEKRRRPAAQGPNGLAASRDSHQLLAGIYVQAQPKNQRFGPAFQPPIAAELFLILRPQSGLTTQLHFVEHVTRAIPEYCIRENTFSSLLWGVDVC